MCTYLKKLLLFNNNIRVLPNAIGSLYQLEVIGIEGNPIDAGQKAEVMEKGTKALMQTLREEAPSKKTFILCNFILTSHSTFARP